MLWCLASFRGLVGSSSLAAYIEGIYCACVYSSPFQENHVAGWCKGSARIDCVFGTQPGC